MSATPRRMTAEEFMECYSGQRVEYICQRVVWKHPPDWDELVDHPHRRMYPELIYHRYLHEDLATNDERARRYMTLGFTTVVSFGDEDEGITVYRADGTILRKLDEEELDAIPDLMRSTASLPD